MDYFQGVVTEYLRADRARFVNTECLIQLNPSDALAKGTHWYCDAVAVNFRESAVYLCEVTYSTTLYALVARLKAWSTHWPAIRTAIVRDCSVPESWRIQPWVFIPEARHGLLQKKLALLTNVGEADGAMPTPLVTYLESVVPWKYHSWDWKLKSLESDAHNLRDSDT